jgi:LmbE family N-acetylglucosaminyl deacetylase
MVDLLAVCAHPDDFEISIGGTFSKAKAEGLKIGAIIFTKGESGGYAEKSTREAEAMEGAKLIGLDYFEMLNFPDAGVVFGEEAIQALVPHLRACSPKYIFTFLEDDYHPDHVAVSKITKAAAFVAGLKKHSADGTDWHYDGILYFGAGHKRNRRWPDIYVDISDHIDIKIRACDAHRSQNITEVVMALSRGYGRVAGVEYAEGLYLGESITIKSISGLMK